MRAAAPIIVVGAGIGGLASALFLARAGWPVTLIERRARPGQEGAGLQLSPNASRVLIESGLGAALERLASRPEHLRIRRAGDGGEIAVIPLGSHATRRYGAPYFVIHRADLAALLLDAVRADTRIRLIVGGEAEEARQRAEGVAVKLADGGGAGEMIEASAVVAAHGLWSALKVGPIAPALYSGFAAWRALVPTNAAPEFARANEVGLWLAPRAHLVHYPIRTGEAVNIVAVLPEPRPREGWSRPGDAHTIRLAFADWAGPARSLVAAAQEWRCWSLFDRRPRRVWGRGRVTLLGDAAHPMLPFLAQGAAMAIEDATVLAATLTHSTGANVSEDIEVALRRYERERFARTAHVQRLARRNAIFYHARWPLAVARDIALSAWSGERLLARYDWLYGWRKEPR